MDSARAVQDPHEPRRWLVPAAADVITGTISGPKLLKDIHLDTDCVGRGCPFHHPSDHPLRDAPLRWCEDKALLERVCEHGTSHPDFDDEMRLLALGRSDVSLHTCCPAMCCSSVPPSEAFLGSPEGFR